MAHAAYTVQNSVNGTRYSQTTTNGVITSQQTVVRVKLRVTDAAAATTKNPVAGDGTRRMAPWSRRGGVLNGVSGLLVRTRTSGSSVIETLYRGVLASPGPFPGSIPTRFPQGEVEALRSALGSFGKNEVQLGVALQEARQTVDLVGKYYTRSNQLAGKLASTINGSKRVKQQFRAFARNGWRDVPSAYLEFLFGVMPLADDISNAMTVLQDTMEKRGAFLLVLRGKFERSDSYRSASFNAPDAGPLSGVQQDIEVNQRQSASLRFQLPDWYWDRLPPVTPFRQAWETTRLSFVADWVFPISSWLGGFEGLQLRPFFKDGCVSTLLKRKVSGAFWSDPQWTFVPESSGGEDYSFSRRVLSAFPTEELFALPRMNAVLGTTQLRVGAALLGQRLASIQKMIY